MYKHVYFTQMGYFAEYLLNAINIAQIAGYMPGAFAGRTPVGYYSVIPEVLIEKMPDSFCRACNKNSLFPVEGLHRFFL